MKIHATRVPAPTVTQQHGTKWQVAVTLPNGDVQHYDKVVVEGRCAFVAIPETEPETVQPRVYAEPTLGTAVTGVRVHTLGAPEQRTRLA